MKIFKTVFILFLSFLFLFTLCSCSSSKTTGTAVSKAVKVTKTYNFDKYEDKFSSANNFYFILNGKSYILPCSVSNFTKLGYKFSEEDSKSELKHNYYETVTLKNKDDEELSLTLYNDDYVPQKLSTLVAYGFSIRDANGKEKEKLSNNLTVSSKIEEVCDKLGKPGDFNFATSTNLLTLNYKNNKYTIDFKFSGDKCTELNYLCNFH